MLLVVLYEMLCAARDVQAILRALVRAIWQMMLRATIACIGVFDVANDAARKNCVRVCNWICARCFPFIVACDIANDAGCNQLYSVQKPYIAAVSHDADCVSCWTLCCVRWQQASWCMLCSTRFIHLTKSLLFFLDLVTLVAIAVMVQCLAQEYGSSKLLQKCLVSRISPFSSTPAHKLAEDSSVKVPSHYRSGWKEMYR